MMMTMNSGRYSRISFLWFLIYFYRCISYHIVEVNHEYYLLNRGVARKIPDEATVKTLGYDLSFIEKIPEDLLREFNQGPSVPLIFQKAGDPDEIMRVELLKNDVLQGRLLYDIQYIGQFINPSLVLFKNRLFLAGGLGWGIVDGKKANEMLEFRWMNVSFFPFFSTDNHYGVPWNQIDYLHNTQFLGQDPRMLVIDEDHIFLCYTNRFGSRLRMGELFIFLFDINS